MSDVLEQPEVPQSPDVHTGGIPGYALAETLVVDQANQFKAFGDPIRRAILDLVLERAASTTELAEAIGRPKGTIDHHLKVLERAGLVRVVSTRQVRAMTEKHWGRTARTFMFSRLNDDSTPHGEFLRDAAAEIADAAERGLLDGDACKDTSYSTLRHARLSPERMRELIARLDALAVEFVSSERGGDLVHGLLIVAYPTTHPVLGAPK